MFVIEDKENKSEHYENHYYYLEEAKLISGHNYKELWISFQYTIDIFYDSLYSNIKF